MNLRMLLNYLSENGIRLMEKDGKLRVASAGKKIPSHILEAIKAHKEALVKKLKSGENFTPSDFPCAQITQAELDTLQASYPLMANLYQVTPLQEGMLFHGMLDGTGESYTTQTNFEIHGEFNSELYKDAWRFLVARHDVFRTCFVGMGGQSAHQLVQSQVSLDIHEENWRTWDAKTQAERLAIYQREDKAQGFDFSKAPLTRLALFRLSDDTVHCLWTHHHVLIDGWSLPIIFNELKSIYRAYCEGKSPVLNASPSYEQYIQWLQRQDNHAARQYWENHLSGFSAPTPLVLNTLPVVSGGTGFREYRQTLDSQLSERLAVLVKDTQTTLNVLIQAVWAIALNRYSGESSVVFGSTVSGRPPSLTGVERMVGLCLNTIPIRVDVHCEETLASLVANLHKHNIDREEYGYLSLSEVQRLTAIPKGTSLFDSLVVYENYPVKENDGTSDGKIGELVVDNFSSEEWNNYSLSLAAAQHGGALILRLGYQAEDYEEATIQQILNHLICLLQQIANKGLSQKVGDLCLITEKEKQCLLGDWNDTQKPYAREKCIHALFEQTVKTQPDAIAAIEGDRRLSYSELNAQANQLAHFLHARGVGPDSLVGISSERSLDMLVGILGILKAGGAYVPIDPEYPEERQVYMLEDSGVEIMLTQSDLMGELPFDDLMVIPLDESMRTRLLSEYSEDNLDLEQSAEQLAYVIYTSGSTGTPKGTLANHRNVVRLVDGAQEYLGLNEPVRTILAAPISFDAATFEIWVPLLNGGCVVCYATSQFDVDEYNQVIETHQVNVSWLTAGLFDVWVKSAGVSTSPLKTLITGGDIVSLHSVKRLHHQHPRIRLVNGYGPTECVTFSCCHVVDRQQPLGKSMPIGKPIRNTQVYILSSSMQLCPVGVAGELYIGGDGVTRGYLNQATQTAEKFIGNPFVEGDRLYRTGDLVRWLADGTIEFISRMDTQIKLRGFRIELGEIETQLRQHARVRDAVVIAKALDSNEQANKILVAYVVVDSQMEETRDSAALNGMFQSYLKQHLPEYMVPSITVALSALPLTDNGKVDRAKLPVPSLSDLQTESYVAPRTDTESLLCEIWQEVLKLEKIGIEDNFFEIGGHSLMATRVISIVRQKFDTDIPISQLFDHPTIAQFAKIIEKSAPQGGLPAIECIPSNEDAPLSFAQERLWVINQMEGGSAHYNIPLTYFLSGCLDILALNAAFKKMLNRHQTLRTVFIEKGDAVIQVLIDEKNFNIDVISFQHLSKAEQDVGIERLRREDAKRSFDLSSDYMIRVKLLLLEDERFMMLLNFHHIAVDGWSMAIFFKELKSLYFAESNRKEVKLPKLEIHYRDFAAWQRRNEQSEENLANLDFWCEELKNAPQLHSLPLDFPRPKRQSYEGKSYHQLLDIETKRRLNSLCENNGCTMFIVLHALFALLVSKYSDERDVVIGTPVAGRSHEDVANLIGFFVNTLVLRTEVDPSQSVNDYLAKSKKIFIRACEKQDVSVEKIVNVLNVNRDPSYGPLFQLLFILQNNEKHDFELDRVVISPYGEDTAGVVKYDIELCANLFDEGVSLFWNYNASLFKESTIRRMAESFSLIIHHVINTSNLDGAIQSIPILPADQVEQQTDNKVPLPIDERYASRCLHELFEYHALAQPTCIAARKDDCEINYQNLNEKANQLAHCLREKGVGPEKRVALYFDSSVEYLITCLAVLKAGGAYVPIDVNYPKARAEMIFADSDSMLVMSSVATQGQYDFSPNLFVDLNDFDRNYGGYSKNNIAKSDIALTDNNLAYVVYTSGTTGRPKGVMVEHRQIVFSTAARLSNYPEFAARNLIVSSVSFDITTGCIFWGLCSGGYLEMAKYDVKQFSNISCALASGRINNFILTPSMYGTLLEQELTLGVKQIILGGEPLEISLYEKHRSRHKDIALYNEYGPSETVVWSSSHKCDESDIEQRKISIGKPTAGVEYYVFNRELESVPVGVKGELYIGGLSVSRGYLNRPELTSERFIVNPFDKSARKLYKTGDLVRRLENGDIEFIGRADNQVKIRGFRIELGEVEHQILAVLDGARVSVLTENSTGQNGADYLVAYIALSNGNKDKAHLISHCKQKLKEKLPEFMIPAKFIVVDEMPLTENGKIDNNKLRECRDDGDFLSGSEIAKKSLELQVQQIWESLLDVKNIGVNQNFFEVGGTSLLSVKLQKRIHNETSYSITVTEIFANPTIKGMAEFLAAKHGEMSSSTQNLGDESDSTAKGKDVAIIGYAGRFPESEGTDDFWSIISEGREVLRVFSDEELLAAGVPGSLLEHPNYVKTGVLLEGIEYFDASYFGFTPKEAEVMDPQQRLLFEVSAQALEQAGYGKAHEPRSIGVFVGARDSLYLHNNLLPQKEKLMDLGHMAVMNGNSRDFVATRLSYKLNLTGPSVNVSTACSTSLVAVHQACNSLRNGEARMALAGGVSISKLAPEGYMYEEGGILSTDGRCRPFDEAASGTREGSGAGVVLLKLLDQAIEDGDTIFAVIKGSAINNDGSDKVGYSAPSVSGQEKVIRAALKNAAVSPETISYVETHGTGTKLGDPIELEALSRAYGVRNSKKEKACALGSIKANIGHCDVAAGVASLIKVIESLKNKKIPPSTYLLKINSEINLDNNFFYINKSLEDWSENDTPLRAGVSSFGIGGTNAHLILQAAPKIYSDKTRRRYHLLPVSAKSKESLIQFEQKLNRRAQHLSESFELADIAYTLQIGKGEHEYRDFVVLDDSATTFEFSAKNIQHAPRGKSASFVFMFPGQGSQYYGMAKALYDSEPAFSSSIDSCAEIIDSKLGIDIKTLMFSSPEDSAPAKRETDDYSLDDTLITQAALFSVEYALAKYLIALGIQPDAMIGHSLGEYVAATLAGVFSLQDALNIVCVRGKLMHSTTAGEMISINVPRTELEALVLDNGCSIAADNADDQCVVSGSKDAIARLSASLVAKGLEVKSLATSHAFHSAMMDGILAEFHAAFKNITLSTPNIPYISNLTGEFISQEQVVSADYWARHLRNCVEFKQGIRSIMAEDQFLLENKVFMEVGPGVSLTSLARRNRTGQNHAFVQLLPHKKEKQSSDKVFFSALGKLWTLGAELNWQHLYTVEKRKRVPLPNYVFERKRHWIDALGVVTNVVAEPKIESTQDVDLNPESDVESALLTIWTNLLGLENISPSDSFFALGGDSILLIRMLNMIKERMGIKDGEISIESIYENPSILAVAELLEAEKRKRKMLELQASIKEQGKEELF